nr:Ubiquitin carboxyl-terminal hydrolase 13 [Ipomoea batatas]
MTAMNFLLSLILIERMGNICLLMLIGVFATSIHFTVCWSIVVVCMVDTIMLSSGLHYLINGTNLMMNGSPKKI